MLHFTRALSSFLVATVALGGCTETGGETSEHDAVSERGASVAEPAWQAHAEREADATRREDASLATLVDQLEPRRTRAGHLRFTTSAIHDPRVAALFLVRLAEGNDPPAVRAALVEALPRTGGDYAEAVVELLGEETEPEVRLALVASLRHAPVAHAMAGLEIALRDDDPAIRALATETAGLHDEGRRLAEPLRVMLGDADGAVRAAAARAMGILGVDAAADELAGLVGDAVAEVRLEALRALGRLAPESAARLPQLEDLRRDVDPRVARVARAIPAD